jgi:NAD dependent epimerase/dehydratase family enzyme
MNDQSATEYIQLVRDVNRRYQALHRALGIAIEETSQAWADVANASGNLAGERSSRAKHAYRLCERAMSRWATAKALLEAVNTTLAEGIDLPKEGA